MSIDVYTVNDKKTKTHKRVVLKGNEKTEEPFYEKPAPTTVEHEYFDPSNIHSDGSEFDDDGEDR